MKNIDSEVIEQTMCKSKITLVTDNSSWINYYIPILMEKLGQANHETKWIHQVELITTGDFVFYLGCSQIISKNILSKNTFNLVVHESALPLGKGWSPLTWQIIEGKNEIPITLFEAVEKVDSGKIYLTDILRFEGTELVVELRHKQAEISIKLCIDFVNNYPAIISQGIEQKGQATYYKRRDPSHSRLNIDQTIREQFNLFRVVDNERYPAFFEFKDETYIVKIEKKEKHE